MLHYHRVDGAMSRGPWPHLLQDPGSSALLLLLHLVMTVPRAFAPAARSKEFGPVWRTARASMHEGEKLRLLCSLLLSDG